MKCQLCVMPTEYFLRELVWVDLQYLSRSFQTLYLFKLPNFIAIIRGTGSSRRGVEATRGISKFVNAL